jgi:hypothetical protein
MDSSDKYLVFIGSWEGCRLGAHCLCGSANTIREAKLIAENNTKEFRTSVQILDMQKNRFLDGSSKFPEYSTKSYVDVKWDRKWQKLTCDGE